MKRCGCMVFFFMLYALVSPLCSDAATVRQFALPPGFTVKPEGEVRRIAISADGSIVALADSTDRTARVRAFRWNAAGERAMFTPLPVVTQPDPTAMSPAYPQAVAAGASIYVTSAANWSGAYGGTSTEVQRWRGGSAARVSLPDCVDSADEHDQKVYDADDDGRFALTMDMTGIGSFQVMSDKTGYYAPYAFVVRDGVCRKLGRGIVLSVRGQWASGYRGYLEGHLAADNINTIVQTPMAIRWYGTQLREMGEGDALAINAGGLAAGADAIPGRFDSMTTNFFSQDGSGHTYHSAVPHALVWDLQGRRFAIAPNARRSVAYDVSDDGTVVGMLVGRDGRHYAFRWRKRKLELLDDLPHPPGWRFESAYAIAGSGAIVGIGTYNGTPMVFETQI